MIRVISLFIAAFALSCADCGDANNSLDDADASSSNNLNSGGDAGPNNAPNNTTDAGNNEPSANVLSVSLPPEAGSLGPYMLTANTPVRLPLSFSLPADAGQLKRLTFDLEGTAAAMGIARTDGGTSAGPTVTFRLGAVAGDNTDGACEADPVVDMTITGNSDFSEKTATESGTGVEGVMAADDGSNVFSACFEVESSVDVELTPGAVVDLELDAECDEPPEDVTGTWIGPYECTNSCGETESGSVDLTVLQAGETAVYFDDGGAIYFGSVCGSTFRFVGGHPFYSEWGALTRTGATTATKTSTYRDTMDPTCGGDCSDELTLQ